MKEKLSREELIRISKEVVHNFRQQRSTCFFNNSLSSRRKYFMKLLEIKFLKISKIKKINNKTIIFVYPTEKLLSYKINTKLVKRGNK